MERRKRSIVLLSGGLDSLVSFKKAYDETKILLVLTFDYGQRSSKMEVEAARKCCLKYNIPFLKVSLPWLKKITKSPLIRGCSLPPQISLPDLSQQGKMKKLAKVVWVPNRNSLFINIAASYAEALDADFIITGFNAEEGRSFPDNSREFV